MKKRKANYTQREDDIVLNCIKESPTNLSQAFRNAARLLTRRTYDSVRNRWQAVLKYKYSYVVTTGSSKGFSNNCKNDIKGNHNLKPFQVIVKQMLNLSNNDREQILNFFK